MYTNPSAAPSGDPFHGPLGGDIWKRRLVIALTALVVLVSGIIVGAGLAMIYVGRTFLLQPATTPEQAARLVVGKISAAVSLTDDERRQTEDLVGMRVAEAAAIRRRYEDEISRKFGDMGGELTEIIGPERMRKCGHWMRYRLKDAPPSGQAVASERGETCRCHDENRTSP